MQNGEVRLIRPPVSVGPGPTPLGSRGGNNRVLTLADARRLVLLVKHVLVRHVLLPFWVLLFVDGSTLALGRPIDPIAVVNRLINGERSDARNFAI
jgi:hypothetical protein